MRVCIVAAVAVGAVVVCAAGCVGAPDDDDEGEGEGEGEGEEVDDEDCADVGAGVALEETAAFRSGDAPNGVVVLMGGGVEVDRASALFVDGAGGGDVLVLRATGSTSSYTGYFDPATGELEGITTAPRAVATARLDDASAGGDAGLLCRVSRADAIWLAGGDQSDYLLSWPRALHDALAAAVARGVAVGGTSAGAMALSEIAYDARDGGVT